MTYGTWAILPQAVRVRSREKPTKKEQRMEKELVSRVINQDYRITRTPSTVRIDVLDYHAGSLTLTSEQLREFGLELRSLSLVGPPGLDPGPSE